MFSKEMLAVGSVAVVILAYFGWKWTARSAYESAQYTVLVADGPFETRQYPELMIATTDMRFKSQGGDGSFMRLFGYISGANDQQQKIAMTSPVFMEGDSADAPGRMGFVIPKEVTERSIPAPSSDSVRIRARTGGQFAVIRFAGRITPESFVKAEKKLRQWMKKKELVANGDAELAGYDPPWTPGPLRRNEVLIRLQ